MLFVFFGSTSDIVRDELLTTQEQPSVIGSRADEWTMLGGGNENSQRRLQRPLI